MFNHIYGSPFPTINPKVRYKTVFERAGFDTNFRGAPIQNEQESDRRNVSTSNLQYALPTKNQGTRIHSLPGMSSGKGRTSATPSSTAAPIFPLASAPKIPSLSELQETNQKPDNVAPYESNTLARSIDNSPTDKSCAPRVLAPNPYTVDGPAQKPYGTNTGTKNPYSTEGLPQHSYGIEPPARNPYRTNNAAMSDGVDGSSKDLAFSGDELNRPGVYCEIHLPQQSPQMPPKSRSSSKSAGSSVNRRQSELGGGTFDFEVAQASQGNLDPIEKSFMMLTQNHSSGSEHSMTSDSGTRSMHTARVSLQNYGVSPISNLHIPSVTEEDFPDSDDDDKDSHSLNFEPCAELDISFSSDKKDNRSSGIYRSETISQPPPLPTLEVTTHFDADPVLESSTHMQHSDTISNLERNGNKSALNSGRHIPLSANCFDEKCVTIEEKSRDTNEQTNQEFSRFSSLNVEPISDYSPAATNSQLENLLAQFNDVPEHKNAQLDAYVNSSTNTISDSATSPVGARSLSVDKSLSPNDSVTHFKKSSAYLSGYPMNNIPQSSNINVESESVVSKIVDGPAFYNFKQQHLNEFTKSNDSLLQKEAEGPFSKEQVIPKDCIAPVQLKHKTNNQILQEGSQKQLPEERKREQPEEKRHLESSSLKDEKNCGHAAILVHGPEHGPENNDAYGHFHDQCPKEEQTRKYPQGEGPCRLCGLEVTEKGIFSKKDNELSGQWHRSCFRCLKCGVKFSKQTPCYILDDKPYCQQHYHEENNSICQICNGFIEGECLENDRGERFHVNCLTCFLCKTPIASDYFIYNEELPLCGHHDMEALVGEDSMDLGGKGNLSKRRTRLINFSQS